MVHKYNLLDRNIVLDVNSGSVHIVDDTAYDVLGFFENLPLEDMVLRLADKHSEASVREAYAELSELKAEGLLFTEDNFGKIAYEQHRKPVVKALCLHIAHACNLKCRYCFAEDGTYHQNRALMSAEVGKQAIDFLIKNSGNRRNLEIDFFGGEPLMNFDVVKEIVEYARTEEAKHDKNFRFTITTNGLLLDDEKISYINENMHNVVLSLDGRKEVNDAMRLKYNGGGSYDDIVDKFVEFASSRNQTDYYVRGTFTKHNLDFAKDVLHLADLGFKQISVEPVVAPDCADYAITNADLPAVFAEYENLAKKIVEERKNGNWFNFFHFMIDLTGGPCVVKRVAGCGAGIEYLAVTPEGDLYPCHQFVGDSVFLMGNVAEGLNNEPLPEDFSRCNVYAKPECEDCFAKFYCSGGCAANAHQLNGSIFKPYEIGCDMQRKRVECALAIKAAQA